MRKILDLGCGNEKLDCKDRFPDYDFSGDVIGLDMNKTNQTDLVCDLNKGVIPFKDNHFDIVYTNHVLEHLKDSVKIILEVHRILKKGGYFLIRVPHVSHIASSGDLFHIKLFSYSSLDFIISGRDYQMRTNKRFKLIKKKIVFGRLYKFIGIEFLANSFPGIYNCFFIGIFPAREMHWELMKK